MIVPDGNLLVYAFNTDARMHKEAAKWWEDCLNGNEIVGLPWIVLQAFIRLLSNRSVVKDPYSVSELFAVCDEWLAIDIVALLEQSQTTYTIWRDLLVKGNLPGDLTTDALIAAVAMENEGTVHSNDHDLSRFPKLKRTNPFDLIAG